MRDFTILIMLIVLSLPYNSTAQNGLPAVAGARGAGMGNASVTFHDIYSAFSNQAGLAYLETASFALHGERRFMVADISSISLAAAMPTEYGSFGLSVNYFGTKEYNEQKIGLAYARKLSKKLAIGAQFDYLSTRIPEYGNKSSMTFEVGVQSDILENLRVGFHVFSPVRVKITEEDVIPTQLTFGLSYLPSKKLILSAEVEKDIAYPMSIKAGVEYMVVSELALRAGMGTAPGSNSFGMGLYLKKFRIDVAASYHRTLGFSPHFSMVFNLGKSSD